jgi:hypothetical protein
MMLIKGDRVLWIRTHGKTKNHITSEAEFVRYIEHRENSLKPPECIILLDSRWSNTKVKTIEVFKRETKNKNKNKNKTGEQK